LKKIRNKNDYAFKYKSMIFLFYDFIVFQIDEKKSIEIKVESRAKTKKNSKEKVIYIIWIARV
jgi:hypothetical protein